MQMPQVTREAKIITKRRIKLNQQQLDHIIREWAVANHGMIYSGIEIDYDAGHGFLNAVDILEIRAQDEPEAPEE